MLNAVRFCVLEHGARPTQVDAITILTFFMQVGDRRHVNDRLGPEMSKHVLGGTLAHVDDVDGDPLGGIGPRARVDPCDFVPTPDELAHDLSRQQA
jgi:hypothetical protein